MISKDTILSIFNEKGTLLKWLQKLEKAYTGAELTGVEITQTNPVTAILTFLFEDGTTVKSEPLTLPQGPAGKDGKDGQNGADGTNGKDGNGIVSIVSGEPYISGDKTITPITIDTDEDAQYITVSAQNGTNGERGAPGANGTNGADGVGIESVMTLGYREGTGGNVGYTETKLKVHMTDNTDKDLSVFAKDGDRHIYHHLVKISQNPCICYVEFYLSDNAPINNLSLLQYLITDKTYRPAAGVYESFPVFNIQNKIKDLTSHIVVHSIYFSNTLLTREFEITASANISDIITKIY